MKARTATAVLRIGLALCVGLALPAGVATASQTVRLFASFEPNRPGASTTITFGFRITSPKGRVPSPLQGIDLHLPGGIGIIRNTLGTAVCEPSLLYARGPGGCPANSVVGYGTAVAKVPYGPKVVQESASLHAYRGVSEGEDVTVLFFAEGWSPVFADLVFPGRLLEDRAPFSNRLDTQVPLVPSLPGGPNVSIVQFQSTFGPKNLLYEREVNGEIQYFRPRGVSVPLTCPSGGYPFAGDFSFEDGSHQTVKARAPCPPRGAGRRRAKRALVGA